MSGDVLSNAINDVLMPALEAHTGVMKTAIVEMPATPGAYDPTTGAPSVTRQSFTVRGAIVSLGFRDRMLLKGISSVDFKFLLPTKGLEIEPVHGAKITVAGIAYNVEALLSHGGGALLAFHVKKA